MAIAAIQPHLRVLALHNLASWVPERAWFVSRGGMFYESNIENAGPNWTNLRGREVDHAHHSKAARSLDESSLGVMIVDDDRRRTLRHTTGLEFGLHQPFLVRLLWGAGAYTVTPKLYGLSYRLLGR